MTDEPTRQGTTEGQPWKDKAKRLVEEWPNPEELPVTAKKAPPNIRAKMIAAGVPLRYTYNRLSDFSNLDLPKDWSGAVCIRGGTGSRKSSLAGAFVRHWLGTDSNAEDQVAWVPALEFTVRIKSTTQPGARETQYSVLQEIKRKKVVVIDDLGSERAHDWDWSILKAVLWGCWDHMQILIITTTMDLGEIFKRYDERDESTVSRINAMTTIKTGDKDYRREG